MFLIGKKVWEKKNNFYYEIKNEHSIEELVRIAFLIQADRAQEGTSLTGFRSQWRQGQAGQLKGEIPERRESTVGTHTPLKSLAEC